MISSQSRLKDFERYLEEILVNIYPSPTNKSKSIYSKCRKPRNFKAKAMHRAYESVIGPIDKRKKVKNAEEWPYSVHGVIEGRFEEEELHGTGILIGPNIVLTAGHNLYYPKKNIFITLESLRFLPGVNGDLLPFGEIKVEKYFVSPNFVKEEKEDYGIIILKDAVGYATGFFGLACLKPEEFSGKTFSIAGYPKEKADYESRKYELWKMKGFVSLDLELSEIHYKTHTTKGQSGSGVFYKKDNEYFVCGVHVQGGEIKNVGTLITKKAYQQIYNWVQENVKKEMLLSLGQKYLQFKLKTVDRECLLLLFQYDLESLSKLILSHQIIENHEIRELTKNISWINLSKLDLSWNSIGDEGAAGIGRNTSWINLSDLNLSGNKIGDEGAAVIGRNTSWANLSNLNLFWNKIGNEGAAVIGRNTSWANLSDLNLSGNKIGDEGAAGIGRNTSWTNLSRLSLSGNKIGDEGAAGIGRNTSWANLSNLNLFWNKIGDEGAAGIGRNTSWINLSSLYLSRNKIGDEGAAGIGRNTSWINLSKLDLGFNNIHDKGAKALSKNTSWIKLQYLCLNWNAIADEGVQEFMKNSSRISHWRLELDGNKIGDKGAEVITQSSFKSASLRWNNISFEQARMYQDRFSISNISEHDFYRLDFNKRTLNINHSDVYCIWKTLENSKTLDPLRLAFSSEYRSFLRKIKPRRHFEDFIISISHLMHSRLDLNFPLPNTEEEDDQLIEELSFNSNPFFSIGKKHQLSIEEGNVPAQNYPNINLNNNNSNNFSEENVQPPLKNTYLNSS